DAASRWDAPGLLPLQDLDRDPALAADASGDVAGILAQDVAQRVQAAAIAPAPARDAEAPAAAPSGKAVDAVSDEADSDPSRVLDRRRDSRGGELTADALALDDSPRRRARRR